MTAIIPPTNILYYTSMTTIVPLTIIIIYCPIPP